MDVQFPPANVAIPPGQALWPTAPDLPHHNFSQLAKTCGTEKLKGGAYCPLLSTGRARPLHSSPMRQPPPRTAAEDQEALAQEQW